MKLSLITLFFITLTFNLLADQPIVRFYGTLKIDRCVGVPTTSTCRTSTINLSEMFVTLTEVPYGTGYFRGSTGIYNTMDGFIFNANLVVTRTRSARNPSLFVYDFKFTIESNNGRSSDLAGPMTVSLNDYTALPSLSLYGNPVRYYRPEGTITLYPVLLVSGKPEFYP